MNHRLGAPSMPAPKSRHPNLEQMRLDDVAITTLVVGLKGAKAVFDARSVPGASAVFSIILSCIDNAQRRSRNAGILQGPRVQVDTIISLLERLNLVPEPRKDQELLQALKSAALDLAIDLSNRAEAAMGKTAHAVRPSWMTRGSDGQTLQGFMQAVEAGLRQYQLAHTPRIERYLQTTNPETSGEVIKERTQDTRDATQATGQDYPAPPGSSQDLQAAVSEILSTVEHKRAPKSSVHIDEDSDMARGGYGEVRRATLDGHSLPVAVKALRPAGTRDQRLRAEIAFARELRVWFDLDHPNILPLLKFYSDSREGTFWFISPFLGEGNIKDYLTRTNPGTDIRFRLSHDTAAGLAYLHSKKVCHGDIKTANVLVESVPGPIKALICDFGLSRIREADSAGGLTTSSFDSKGSPRYMAPELLHSEIPRRSLASDVWAWGCVVLEIIADTMPYQMTRSDLAIMNQITMGKPPVVLGTLVVDQTVRGILQRCWQSEGERPPMAECQRAFGTLLT